MTNLLFSFNIIFFFEYITAITLANIIYTSIRIVLMIPFAKTVVIIINNPAQIMHIAPIRLTEVG